MSGEYGPNTNNYTLSDSIIDVLLGIQDGVKEIKEIIYDIEDRKRTTIHVDFDTEEAPLFAHFKKKTITC